MARGWAPRAPASTSVAVHRASTFDARPTSLTSKRRNGLLAWDQLIVHFDLPGIDPDSIELTVEKEVLTVKAPRSREQIEDSQWLVPERLHGNLLLPAVPGRRARPGPDQGRLRPRCPDDHRSGVRAGQEPQGRGHCGHCFTHHRFRNRPRPNRTAVAVPGMAAQPDDIL